MDFLDKFKSVLPREISFNELYELAPDELWKINARMAAIKAINRSGLFDKNKYLDSYADVKNDNIDAVHHFIMHGIDEGRIFFKNCIDISVVIVTYCHENYIEQAIKSVLDQKVDFNFEIIISDDGSNDKTESIIKYYKDMYPFIISDISEINNIGISNNYRKCFEKARGKYISILEGDDYWFDKKLEYHKNFLDRHDRCNMVFSKVKILDKFNKFKDIEFQNTITTEELDYDDFFKFENINPIVNLSSCTFRSKVLKNLPDEIYLERFNEIAVSFYLLKNSKIGFINEYLNVWRHHDLGVWCGQTELEQYKTAYTIRKNILKFIPKKYRFEFDNVLKRYKIKCKTNQFLPVEKNFWPEGYVTLYPDVIRLKMDPWMHYVTIGNKEGRSNGIIPPKDKFWPEGYLFLYPDVKELKMDPWVHYVTIGNKEGRSNGLNYPSEVFWEDGYRFIYPDMRSKNINPWMHYVISGYKEKRSNGLKPPRNVFFKEGYLTLYPEIKKLKIDPWVHYVTIGFKENKKSGINVSPDTFSNKSYLFLNPDLKTLNSFNIKQHYYKFGIDQGRLYAHLSYIKDYIKTKKNIFFTIVIRISNNSIYNEHIIESILRQTFNNFEIIILDESGNSVFYDNVRKKYYEHFNSIIKFYKLSNLDEEEVFRFICCNANYEWLLLVDNNILLDQFCLDIFSSYISILKNECFVTAAKKNKSDIKLDLFTLLKYKVISIQLLNNILSIDRSNKFNSHLHSYIIQNSVSLPFETFLDI